MFLRNFQSKHLKNNLSFSCDTNNPGATESHFQVLNSCNSSGRDMAQATLGKCTVMGYLTQHGGT